MENKSKSIILVLSMVLLASASARAADDAPDPFVLDQEQRIKTDAESKAQRICDNIMGKDMSNVYVNVELGIESTRKGGSALNRKMESKSALNQDTYILPWVPAPKSVTKDEVPKDANVETQAAQQSSLDVKAVVRRFDIRVIHDKNVLEEKVNETRDTLTAAFDRYKNVLKIYFKANSFVRQDFNPKDTVTKNFWDQMTLKNLIYLFLVFLAYLLLKFFFGPLTEFMKNYIDGMKELSRSRVEMENKSQTENETDENQEGEQTPGEGEMTPEELAALEAEEEAMKKFIPFTYINDENIKQLAYLLHHEEPWIVALVISYLSPDHAFKVMQALPADLQAKVALETAMYRQTSEEQVQAINEDIKQKIDFVVGGLDKLVGILENSDRMAQDNILEYLKNEKPAVYERVREQILLFEDIAGFPKLAMQVVVRELKTEELARALRGASPELQQKFFDNMSQGAMTLLKEEMQYGRPVTDDQIAEERKKIVDFIKSMERDGKISFRQKGKSTAISSDEVGESMATLQSRLAAFKGVNPEESLRAYNAGLAANEQGNLEEALNMFESSVQLDPNSLAALQALANTYYSLGRYQEAVTTFEQLLSLEPNIELQTWVNELKALISASAA